MISTLFNFGNEIIEVRINNTSCLFRTSQVSGALSPIDNIKLSRDGVIKEFPELKNSKDWKKEAIIRFKEHIKKLPNEGERMKYIINDLKKHGYIPTHMQKEGFRIVKIRT